MIPHWDLHSVRWARNWIYIISMISWQMAQILSKMLEKVNPWTIGKTIHKWDIVREYHIWHMYLSYLFTMHIYTTPLYNISKNWSTQVNVSGSNFESDTSISVDQFLLIFRNRGSIILITFYIFRYHFYHILLSTFVCLSLLLH